MTPQTMFWLSSIAGALLFFGAGFLLARMRAEGAVTGEHAGAMPLLGPPPDEELRKELQQLRTALEAAAHERDEATRERDEATRERDAATRERDENREQIQQHKAEIATLQGASKPDQTDKIETLARELAQARAANKELAARAADKQPTKGSTVQEREVEGLRKKLVELRGERDSFEALAQQLKQEGDGLRKSGVASVQTDRRRAITLEQKVVDLEHQLTQERQRGSDLVQQIDEHESPGRPPGERSIHAQELERMQRQADTLQQQLEQQRQRAQQLEQGLEREKRQTEQLRRELGQAGAGEKTVTDGGRQRIIELEHRAAQQAEQVLQLKAQLRQGSSAADAQLKAQLKRETDRAVRAERQLKQESEKQAMTAEKLRTKAEELAHQVVQLKDVLEQTQLARVAAQREAEAADKEVTELKAQASQEGAMVMELESLRQRAAEADELRDEKAELARSLEEAREEITHLQGRADNAQDLETDHHDLKIKATLLGEQVRELEQLREDNARLKASAEAAEELGGKVQQLEAEIVSLRAQGLVKKRPQPEAEEARRPDGLGGSLQTVVEQLEQAERSRGAIVADRAGLVVAGAGEQAEPLAAAASILSEVGERIQQLLPLGVVDCLTYVDENGLVFATRPIAISSEEEALLVATLSVDSPPERELVDKLIAEMG